MGPVGASDSSPFRPELEVLSYSCASLWDEIATVMCIAFPTAIMLLHAVCRS